jgi:hypothetical protein
MGGEYTMVLASKGVSGAGAGGGRIGSPRVAVSSLGLFPKYLSIMGI